MKLRCSLVAVVVVLSLPACKKTIAVAPDATVADDAEVTAVAEPKDAASCASIKDATQRDGCLLKVLSAHPDDTKGAPFCDRLSSQAFKESCWAQIAVMREDESYCSNIADGDACYESVATRKRNSSPCLPIKDEAKKNTCITDVAKMLASAPTCDRIADAGVRKECIAQIPDAPTVTADDDAIRKGITKVSATEYKITRKAWELFLGDETLFMRSVRVVPEMKDGKANGMRVFGVRGNSIPGLLGVENGDRIEKINGVDVTVPEKVVELKKDLKKASKVEIEGARRDKPLKLTITIV